MACGAATCALTSKGLKWGTNKAIDVFELGNEKLTNDTKLAILKSTEKVFEERKLAKHGVKFVEIKSDDFPLMKYFDNLIKGYSDVLTKLAKNNGKVEIPSFKWYVNIIPEHIKAILRRKREMQTQTGMNLFYDYNTKEILFNKDGLIAPLHHELGHAINDNQSKVAKMLIKARPLSYLALPIFITALLIPKNKNAEGKIAK